MEPHVHKALPDEMMLRNLRRAIYRETNQGSEQNFILLFFKKLFLHVSFLIDQGLQLQSNTYKCVWRFINPNLRANFMFLCRLLVDKCYPGKLIFHPSPIIGSLFCKQTYQTPRRFLCRKLVKRLVPRMMAKCT
jgi:hypothetical protein